LVAQNLIIYLHDDVRSRGVLIAWRTRLGLLGFRLMEIRISADCAGCIVIAVIFAFSFLHGVATGARGGDLALTFVLALTLLLLEPLSDCAYLDKAWRLVDLMGSEKSFVHGDVWRGILTYPGSF
jgi:hypothetical protein